MSITKRTPNPLKYIRPIGDLAREARDRNEKTCDVILAHSLKYGVFAFGKIDMVVPPGSSDNDAIFF
jgi:hypothetical protein